MSDELTLEPGTYLRKSWWVSVLCFFGLHIVLAVKKRGPRKRMIVCLRCKRWQQHEVCDGPEIWDCPRNHRESWGYEHSPHWRVTDRGRVSLPPAKVESDG